MTPSTPPPVAGPSGLSASDPPRPAGRKHALTDVEYKRRSERIQKGLDEREAEEETLRRDKGKDVERLVRGRPTRVRPIIGRDSIFGRPFPDLHSPPQPDGPLVLHHLPSIPADEVEQQSRSPSPFPPLTDDDLMSIDAAEKEALDKPPPSNKRSRTVFELGGDEPAPFLPQPPAHTPAPPNNNPPEPEVENGQEPDLVNSIHFQRFAALIGGNPSGDPRMSIASPPIGQNFPPVEGSGPMWLRDGLSPVTMENWEGIRDNKCFTHIFGMSAHQSSPRHDAAMDQLPKLINDIFQIDTIIMARPGNQGAMNKEPNSFLLVGMPDEVLDILLNFRVFSTPQYQFFCYPFEPAFPDFLCTLDNFNPSFLNTSKTAKEDILRAIKDTLMSRPTLDTIRNIVRTENAYAAAIGVLPEHITTVQSAIDSLRVEIVDERIAGGISKPYVNVYSVSPFTRPVLWSAWRDVFKRTSFNGGIAGIGCHTKARTCTGCHGVDHTIGLCPFPKIPGWHKISTQPNEDDATRARNDGNNRGGRPRGRGRGRGGYQPRF